MTLFHLDQTNNFPFIRADCAKGPKCRRPGLKLVAPNVERRISVVAFVSTIMQFQTWNLISIQQMSFSVIGMSFVSPFFLFSKLQVAQLKWSAGGWVGGAREGKAAHWEAKQRPLLPICPPPSSISANMCDNIVAPKPAVWHLNSKEMWQACDLWKWTLIWALEWWPRPHYPSGSLTEDEWDHCGSSSPPNLLGRKSWLHPLQLSSNQHCGWTL